MSLAFDKIAVVKEYKDEIETLQYEKDYLMEKLVSLASSKERKVLVYTELNISLNKQCQLLNIDKSSLYYKPTKPFSTNNDFRL